MGSAKGIIALMGSGEMTSTMVEVHKELLAGCGSSPRAVFIDTPAGFQLNADQLSEKAVDYFRTRINYPLSVVSFKSAAAISPYDAEVAFRSLREADYFLIGPGSPSYAVRQWQRTPVPDIIASRVAGGGCLVAASAAALTVGQFTLPVYEIYKVGAPLHWIEGINTLGSFGFNLVVVPHWNNAEGGNHDTRFCYMGEPRFNELAFQLPADTAVLGLDEHTACLIDLQRDQFIVRGLGRVCLLMAGTTRYFEKGPVYPAGLLKGVPVEAGLSSPAAEPALPVALPSHPEDAFWNTVHQLQAVFHDGINNRTPDKVINALLELDGLIWKSQEELESQEFISQARDMLRDMIMMLGTTLLSTAQQFPPFLMPLVDDLLALRSRCRVQNKWEEADLIRTCLMNAGIIVDDTREGSRWRFQPD
jgi:peptidase E